MQEYNNVYEREIDLVYMLKYLWKKIGYVCGGTIIGLVLVLSIQVLAYYGEENSKQGMTSFEKKMKKYERDHLQLEKEIDSLEKSINAQATYNNESILMKINPYDKKSVIGQFYIDTDYKIIPELMYQNIDITGSVAQAYLSLSITGELANYIHNHLENPIEERYINEVVSMTYVGNGVLIVSVSHVKVEAAREIYDLIVKCMNEKKNEFEKSMGSYSIVLNNESESTSVDLQLKEVQEKNLDTVNTLKNSLEEKQQDFDNLSRPTEGINLITSIIGAVIGGVIVVGFYVVLFLLDTTIKTEQEVEMLVGLPVLSSVPAIEGTKKIVQKGKKKKVRYIQYSVK